MSTKQELSDPASGSHNTRTDTVGRDERMDQRVTNVSTPVVEDQSLRNPGNQPISTVGSSDQIHGPAGVTSPLRSPTSNPAHLTGITYASRDDSLRPTQVAPPINASDQNPPYPSTSQLAPQSPAPTRVDRTQLQPHGSRLVEHVEYDPQETSIRPRGQTLQPWSQTTSPSPPRTPVTSESITPTQVRIVPDTALTRSPSRHYTHLHPSSVVFHEDHGTSDSEPDPDADPRRDSQRKNQPLPPLPGRMASTTALGNQLQARRPQSAGSTATGGFDRGNGSTGYGSRGNVNIGPSGNGAPGVLTVSGYGSEAATVHARNDARSTSVVPILGTNASQPTLDRSRTLRSGVDWLVEDKTREKTVGERLEPTLETARAERDKFAFKAKMTGYSLNIAIGLQVIIGAMTTGLSVVTTGKQTSIMTAILGGFATIVASFLARARGSQEPELSITRVKDLEQFIRECEAFQMDYGHLRASTSPECLAHLNGLRERFEILLGNNGNGGSANRDLTGKGS